MTSKANVAGSGVSVADTPSSSTNGDAPSGAPNASNDSVSIAAAALNTRV